MQNKDLHNFFVLNKDDRPEDLQPGEITDALNMRTGSSKDQHGAGIAETLQSEIELLIGVAANITYYGEPIGGEFIYEGFEEVQIGYQVWMKKNWGGEYPGSKAYDDNESNREVRGGLYTHYQAMAPDFCPDGWRIPTEADWDELLNYVGGLMLAGGKLKEVGDAHWLDPNTGADDAFGFRAIPGGKFDTIFELLETNCLLWLQDDSEPFVPIALNGSEIIPGSFVANWKATPGATGYCIDVATDVGFVSLVMGYDNKDVGNVLKESVNSVGGNCYYRIRAYNEVGVSDNSNIIFLTIPGLGIPVAIDASLVTVNSFRANWNVTPGATGYCLDVSPYASFASMYPGYDNLDIGNVLFQNIGPFIINRTYYYRVRAYNLSEISSDSNVVTTPLAKITPAAPGETLGPELIDQGLWNDVGLAYWDTSMSQGHWAGDNSKIIVSGTGSIKVNNFWEIGSTYKIITDCVISNVYYEPLFDGLTYGIYITESGHYELYFTPGSINMYMDSSGGIFNITSLSIKKVLP